MSPSNPQKLALISPTSGDRSRTQATEFSFLRLCTVSEDNHVLYHVSPSNPQKLALTSPTSGCRSVGIVRSRTQATEFSFLRLSTISEKNHVLYWNLEDALNIILTIIAFGKIYDT
jgi:hypothetical protein